MRADNTEPETEPESGPAEQPWTSHFYAIAPRSRGREVLLLASDGGWALPYVRVQPALWMDDLHAVNAALQSQLPTAPAFTLLRYVAQSFDSDERWMRTVWLLEFQQPFADCPPNGRWVRPDDLPDLPLARPQERELLAAFFAEQATDPPPLRAPWAQPGWFATAAEWIERSLAALGRTQTGPVEQRKAMGISAVLRVPTDTGLVYFKATADLPLFVNEARLTAALAQHFPQLVPTPLKIHPQERWMLMDDFGPHQWGQPVDVLAEVFRRHGQMQATSAGQVEELLAVGCLDRRLPVLAGQIDPLLAHPLTHAHTDPAVLAGLQAATPQLQAACEQLGQLDIPAGIVHGDLHMGNVARREDSDRFVIFDWSDACIAHPFLDLHVAYFECSDPAEQAQLRDAYLSAWAGHLPMGELLAGWALARPLSALHQAVSFLHILIGQEELVHREMADGLSGFLAHALQSLPTEDRPGSA